jgi:DNA repair photolyase
MAELSEAGIPVGIGLAPLAPGLNDAHIPDLLKRAREAGAATAWITMLRLPGSVAPYFEQRLRERLPTKATRILNHVKEEREGRLNSSEFGERMRGTSEQWRLAVQVFKLHCERLGFNQERYTSTQKRNTFRRPSAQGALFD